MPSDVGQKLNQKGDRKQPKEFKRRGAETQRTESDGVDFLDRRKFPGFGRLKIYAECDEIKG